jgi:hypothetical protein
MKAVSLQTAPLVLRAASLHKIMWFHAGAPPFFRRALLVV